MSVHSLMHRGYTLQRDVDAFGLIHKALPTSKCYVKPEGRNLGMAAFCAWPEILTGGHKDACIFFYPNVLLILGVLNLHVIKSLSH